MQLQTSETEVKEDETIACYSDQENDAMMAVSKVPRMIVHLLDRRRQG